jgi:hypothetical protein
MTCAHTRFALERGALRISLGVVPGKVVARVMCLECGKEGFVEMASPESPNVLQPEEPGGDTYRRPV